MAFKAAQIVNLTDVGSCPKKTIRKNGTLFFGHPLAFTVPYSYGRILYGNNNRKVTAVTYGTVRPTSKELYTAVPYNTVRYGYGRIVTGCGRSLSSDRQNDGHPLTVTGFVEKPTTR